MFRLLCYYILFILFFHEPKSLSLMNLLFEVFADWADITATLKQFLDIISALWSVS